MKYLITGITGHIGRHLEDIPHFSPLDFRKPETWTESFLSIGKPFGVLHLAATLNSQDVRELREINVDRSYELAETALNNGASRFIFASTGHVYGSQHEEVYENSPAIPSTEYAKSKLEAETVLQNFFGQNSDAKLSILRIFSLLDFGMKSNTLGGRIERIIAGELEAIPNSLDFRNFLTPFQAAFVIQRVLMLEGLPQTINVCSDTALSVQESATLMLKSREFDAKKVIFEQSFSTMPNIVGNNNLLKSLLGLNQLEWQYFQELD